jgi:hypothetical protein
MNSAHEAGTPLKSETADPGGACGYVGANGASCPGAAGETGLCRWHDPAITKDAPDDRAKLESWAQSGQSMEGFELASAALAGVNLVKEPGTGGYDLSNANLSHANLSDGHLYQINLRGASLLKTNLNGARLNDADLRGANLLGAVLNDARLENTVWDTVVAQEATALEDWRRGNFDSARVLFREAEEVYRNLRKAMENKGQFEQAGEFFYREMVARRWLLKRYCLKWYFSYLVDIFCGYGENPARVVGMSVAIIFVCGLLYFLLGIGYDGAVIGVDLAKGPLVNLQNFGDSLYFSIVTFTTLGYGDIAPFGWTRVVAAVEAFAGSFILALFVVVFVKKMTR